MTISLKKLNEDRFAIPIKIVAAYLLWKLFYFFADKDGTALGTIWDSFAFALAQKMASATAAVLQIFNIPAVSKGVFVYLLDSGKNIFIGEHCLAIPACVVFVIAILSFSGPVKDKLWFIPLGLLGIQFINLLRVAFLAWIWANRPATMFVFHHSLVTVGITYGLIFLMVIWWMRRTGSITTN